MNGHRSQPTTADTEAARRALARNWPDLDPASPQYPAQLEFLATLHAEYGPEKFALYQNLREPRTREEGWSRDLMQGKLTQAEFGAKLKSDAERPVDQEMLETFHTFYAGRVEQYSSFLQTVASAQRRSQQNPCALNECEALADHYIEDLATAKAPLWKENLASVFEFLEEMRVEADLGLATLGDFEAGSAHWLSELVLQRAVGAWRSSKEVADRSQTDLRYLYATTASSLFMRVWMSSMLLPRTLAEHMRQEFTRARIRLRHQGQGKKPQAVEGATVMSPFEQFRRRLGRFLAHDSAYGIWSLHQAVGELVGQDRVPPADMLSMLWTHFCDARLGGDLRGDGQVVVGVLRSMEAITKRLVACIETVPVAKRQELSELYGRFESDLNRFAQDIELFMSQAGLPDYGFWRLPALSAMPPPSSRDRRGESQRPMSEPESVDVVLLTVLREEAQAVRSLMQGPELALPTAAFPRNLYAWEWGRVDTPRFSAPYTVAHALVGHAGGTPG